MKYKLRFLLGILFIAVSNAFSVFMPKEIGKAVDSVRLEILKLDGSSALDVGEIMLEQGIIFAAIYIGLSIGKGFFLFLTRQTIIVMSRFVEYDLKNEIYAQYQRLSMAFFKRNNTGDLMNRISEDVSKVRMYFGPAVMYSINLFFLMAFTLFQMLSTSVELTLYVLAPLPIMSVIIYFVSRTMNRRSERVQVQQSHLSTMAQETFSGIRVIKAFNREEQFSEEFAEASNDYKRKNMSRVKVDALFMPTITILIGLSVILTIYLGGLKVQAGEISIGDVVGFLVYVNILTWPFASIGWVTSVIQRAEASQKRINEFLLETPDIVNPTDATVQLKGEVSFNDVYFTYPDSGIEALKGVSFSAKPGESLAIIGRTGSGKSTIANLVCRLYDADKGTVTLDGVPIDTLNLDDVRSQIGYVPQEVFLFSDSISNNIAFGIKGGGDQETINAAAEKADLLENILSFQKGFDTVLGERGITLSGGQKQRLSIARAIIKKPQILIFDDCLSAVDTETEENILKSLKTEMSGKTSITISHRVSSVKNADKIIVIEDGRVADEGDHDTLLSKKGIYYDLFQKQLAEEQKKGAELAD